jgi:hypothetical protein
MPAISRALVEAALPLPLRGERQGRRQSGFVGRLRPPAHGRRAPDNRRPLGEGELATGT